MTIDIDVKNIDNNYNITCKTIYEVIFVPYFGEVKLFPKLFLGKFKKHPNYPQNIPYYIKKNIL